MAEILKIENNKVKIGTDDSKVVTVPIAALAYPDPKEGDEVKLYKDGSTYIIKKVTPRSADFISTEADGTRIINKHIFVWVYSFLLGTIGVDRFIRGQIGLGVLKIFFGWFFWGLVDWIIAMVKAYGDYSDTEDLSFSKTGAYTR